MVQQQGSGARQEFLLCCWAAEGPWAHHLIFLSFTLSHTTTISHQDYPNFQGASRFQRYLQVYLYHKSPCIICYSSTKSCRHPTSCSHSSWPSRSFMVQPLVPLLAPAGKPRGLLILGASKLTPHPFSACVPSAWSTLPSGFLIACSHSSFRSLSKYCPIRKVFPDLPT